MPINNTLIAIDSVFQYILRKKGDSDNLIKLYNVNNDSNTMFLI